MFDIEESLNYCVNQMNGYLHFEVLKQDVFLLELEQPT